ncbi:hypothetical protein D1BOALGB6SA_7712 [Olavius sp. associated proteobacterium Delta 1]|nr:hypothetical protein D1BOALGB6SA_7712 [Olavius sp. associated proteobacterium Delta 1]
MKTKFETIWQLAKPYLDTRHNEVHSEISTQLAFELLNGEGGDEASCPTNTLKKSIRIPIV